MKTDTRHATPTTAIMLRRIDRKCNAMDASLKRTMKTLADDFTRVLRQNDTLRGENETLKEMLRLRDRVELTGANNFMAEPLLDSTMARFLASANAERAAAETDRRIEDFVRSGSLGLHDFGENELRCKNCKYLRTAVEANAAAGLDVLCVP